MMLYSFLVSLFVFLCVLMITLILIQQTKSSLGVGMLGGGAQTLFGGSGGQDILQKITWIFAALFMSGSLTLAIMRAKRTGNFTYTSATNITQQGPSAPGE